MKPILPAVLTFFATVSGSNAQTSSPPSAIPLATVGANTIITSKQSEFDLKANSVVYHGNVQAEDHKMRMTCELLTVRMPDRGGRIESIVAEQKVVIDMVDERGQKIHGTGDKAVYTCKATATETNETVELTGNPMLETAQGTLTGDVITYDRTTGKLKATNQKMVVHGDLTGTTNTVAFTNSPATVDAATGGSATTNKAPELPAADPRPSQGK